MPVQETWVPSLGGEDPPEEEMAIDSNIPAWTVPWTEETGGSQSIGSQGSDTIGQLSTHADMQPQGHMHFKERYLML